ncbi:hypothetical protein VNO80_14148 [Phaseolus coccineus]|uniref:Uncharacterized protein n=1 Tax=Phaseolus coccineus TaxID=3886 RepID=A0AAN9R146_PHACN
MERKRWEEKVSERGMQIDGEEREALDFDKEGVDKYFGGGVEYRIFGAYGISCAFDTEGNKAYIFRDNICAYIDYVNEKILSDRIEQMFPFRIHQMFPIIEDTVFEDGIDRPCIIFEDGIDASFTSHNPNQVYIFKGEKYILMNFIPGSIDVTLLDGLDG